MKTTLLLLPAFALSLLAGAYSAKATAATAYSTFNLTDTLPPKDTSGAAPTDGFQLVGSEATFRGGQSEWLAFIGRNLNPEIPIKRKAPIGEYTVVVQFIVDVDGRLIDMKPLTGHGYGMEEEVMRVLRRSPRWIPAVLESGLKVKAYRKQPVTFVVSEAKKGR